MNEEDNTPFIRLMAEHKGIVYKVAQSYCRNEEDRKDLIQEITVQLWRSYPAYNPAYKISTWIYRVAINVAISYYRKTKRHNTYSLTDHIIALTPDPESEQQENIRLLYAFIHQLDDLNKALILLYLDDNNHKEIAQVLGITETNVATKVGRIKEKLKQQFAKQNL